MQVTAKAARTLQLDVLLVDSVRIPQATFEDLQRVPFRLDDEGLAPDGVGKDTSFPVIAGVNWKPTRNLSVAGYAGATFFHEVRLENSSGDTLAKRDVDPSPVIGFSVSYKF